MIEAVLFDLDFTLYDTTQFYLGAFDEMALGLAQRHDRDPCALRQLLASCWRELTSGHPHLFDAFLARAHLPANEVPALVDLLHAHVPSKLELYPDANHVLTDLVGRYHLGIITDGHAGMQRNKLEALGLVDRVDVVILTAEHGPGWSKPSPEPFLAATARLTVAPTATVYVGDNPQVDAGGPSRVGMKAVRLVRGEYAGLPAPTIHPFAAEISSLERLLDDGFMSGL